MKKFVIGFLLSCFLIFVWFLYSEIYSATASALDSVQFNIKPGETVGQLAIRLKEEGVIRNSFLFTKYLQFKGLDKDIKFGEFVVTKPITLKRVVESLKKPDFIERTITIIPGWNLTQVADYFVKEGIASTTPKISKDLEGYLSPNTYRVYKDATVNDILDKLKKARIEELKQFDSQVFSNTGLSEKEILTLASIVEKEAGNNKDMAMVADIFLRRLKEGMALQSCATVNYVTGKNSPGISLSDQKIDSPYNTYKYPGLPPGPICNPSLDAIKAVLYPQKNNYVFFMTGNDGVMRYGRTLSEHNANVAKYLR